MKKQLSANIKTGIFVVSGLLILVFSLYMIGRNKSIFGADFRVKARFRNVNGLMKGNNVRFSGIQAGTVKEISIINDTTVEVVMLINKRTKNYIRKNSLVSIGSEGLMGNKIVNIEPNAQPAAVIEEDDMLLTTASLDIDNMLSTLGKTNANIAVISEGLMTTVRRLNDSKVLWTLLDDTTLSDDVKYALVNIKSASVRINDITGIIDNIMQDVSDGKGTAGVLLRDTATANNLVQTLQQINKASIQLNTSLTKLDQVVSKTDNSINNGNGIVNTLLVDSMATMSLKQSLTNIEKGTAAFSEDMEALKHNFLLRGYFKKQKRRAGK